MSIGIIAIGRNEGERLKTCLQSLPVDAQRIYVDSGSTDGSVAFAKAHGAEVVTLPPGTRFTAALARNAGLTALTATDSPYVQVIDGDCELDGCWIDAAVAALTADPGLAVVFGRRRERFPDASVYNRLCDDEWNVPVGLAMSCGGDALFRRAALDAVGGYNPELIAGEEPDLCQRLRERGWQVRRIDAEMTRHDAAMTRIGQWWRRTERSGHAFAELAWRHGAKGDPHWRREMRSMLVWAVGLPITVLLAAVLFGWWAGLALAALYPVQVARIARRMQRARDLDPHFARALGFFLVAGKFAQVKGAMRYHWRRLTGSRAGLIEYKGTEPQRS
ncbi:glycosyltransferase [Sphingomonas sp. KR1UV-12]|uniref:Glycosyltransferase n=1 Tax=Sphingomonas aurea TaxID=3063994 RepID=A0ABT9EF39_9SPHN|nr:glycosyltransferase family 2 protein [Sphingomonas sp. KR1UV-12]MDP1025584.1 glycosyltransferase [Sphingomonas sp. KR1UV-12]